MQSLRGGLAALVVGVASVPVVLALAILPFLNPVWVGFAQERAQAAAWTGFAPMDLHTVTDALLVDLVLGPPDFDVTLAGQPVLNEAERGHMRDVRTVFLGLYLAAAVGALVLVAAFGLARGRARARLWRRLSRSGLVIAVVTVAGGLLALVFFDAAFALFHRVFFPQGNWQFDPATDRLVQLFPERFWVETSVAVGVVVIVLGIALAWVGGRRAAAIERQTAGTPATLNAVPVR
jgi:integral membrane protein (TIGR01906 family)